MTPTLQQQQQQQQKKKNGPPPKKKHGWTTGLHSLSAATGLKAP